MRQPILNGKKKLKSFTINQDAQASEILNPEGFSKLIIGLKGMAVYPGRANRLFCQDINFCLLCIVVELAGGGSQSTGLTRLVK